MRNNATKFADKAFQDYGGGERGQRAYDAVMARHENERSAAYEAKTWDPTHYADRAFQNYGGGERGQRAYDEVMRYPVEQRHKAYAKLSKKRAAAVYVTAQGPRAQAVMTSRLHLTEAPRGPAVPSPLYERMPNALGVWGCMIPGTDARAAGASREQVERMCSESPSCVGFYGDETPGKSWYLATDTDPAQCKVRGREIYPYFYRKRK
jgi:hypothetical protein